MISMTIGNLTRQFKALELLEQLLEEEYALLQERDTDGISSLEFSIHELLRQIAVERLGLRDTMQGTPLLEYASVIPEEDGQEVRRLFHLIDSLEQRASRLASRNAELSLALLDQGQALLNFLYEQITPRATQVYGSGGRIRDPRPGAALYSGRL